MARTRSAGGASTSAPPTSSRWGRRPALTLGFAFGSGDRNPDDGTDGTFRQTGLQDNEWDFGGATDFKYYGEVLDPELSNLAILTAGVGIRPSDKFSLDLVYHYYLQHRAAPRRFATPGSTPSRPAAAGDSAARSISSSDSRRSGTTSTLKVAVGYFLPGAAFPESSGGAWVVRAEVQFRF